jgi:hypothetical protein
MDDVLLAIRDDFDQRLSLNEETSQEDTHSDRHGTIIGDIHKKPKSTSVLEKDVSC